MPGKGRAACQSLSIGIASLSECRGELSMFLSAAGHRQQNFLLFPSGEWRVMSMCYQKTFRNHNNLNCDRILRAERQLSLIPLNRTAALPAALAPGIIAYCFAGDV